MAVEKYALGPARGWRWRFRTRHSGSRPSLPGTPAHSQSPEPAYAVVRGNRPSEVCWGCALQVAPMLHEGPYKRETDRGTFDLEWKPWAKGVVTGRHVHSPGTPGPPGLGEKEGPSLEPREGARPTTPWIQTCACHNWERARSHRLKPPACGKLLGAQMDVSFVPTAWGFPNAARPAHEPGGGLRK